MLKYEGPQKHAFVLFITHLIVHQINSDLFHLAIGKAEK